MEAKNKMAYRNIQYLIKLAAGISLRILDKSKFTQKRVKVY